MQSDVRIKLANGIYPGHRFVLTARADHWLSSNQSWEAVSELGMDPHRNLAGKLCFTSLCFFF